MSDRESFEKWWPSVGQTIGKVAAWEAWQAAQAQAGDGESPVAWMYEHDGMVHDKDHQPIFTTHKWDFVNEPYTETALYTRPQPAQQVNQQLLEALQPLRLDIFGDGLPNNLYHEPCEHGDFLYYDQVVAAIAAAQEQ